MSKRTTQRAAPLWQNFGRFLPVVLIVNESLSVPKRKRLGFCGWCARSVRKNATCFASLRLFCCSVSRGWGICFPGGCEASDARFWTRSQVEQGKDTRPNTNKQTEQQQVRNETRAEQTCPQLENFPTARKLTTTHGRVIMLLGAAAECDRVGAAVDKVELWRNTPFREASPPTRSPP